MRPVVPLLPLSRHPTPGPSRNDRSADLGRRDGFGHQVDDRFGPLAPDVLRGLVDAADGLGTTYDPDDLLGRVTTHCARLVPGGSAGIILLDSADRPRLAAVTATSARSAALFDVGEQVPGWVRRGPGERSPWRT